MTSPGGRSATSQQAAAAERAAQNGLADAITGSVELSTGSPVDDDVPARMREDADVDAVDAVDAARALRAAIDERAAAAHTDGRNVSEGHGFADTPDGSGYTDGYARGAEQNAAVDLDEDSAGLDLSG